MKILVVCENFSNGGLETQIKTYYDNLPDGNDMIFAFGSYSGDVCLDDAKIYDGFHFSYTDSIKDIIEDVEKLISIIKSEHVDVIHVHPYYSFFAAYLASQVTNTKLFYTFHGVSSFNFIKGVSGEALFQYAFESNAFGAVYSVNEKGIDCFSRMGCNNALLLRNPISVGKKVKLSKDGRWACVSRLDGDKVNEIKLLIQDLDEYGIKKLDIYGSGSMIDDLEEFIKELKLETRVSLMGYMKGMYKTLNGKYDGVIGIGRTLLEASSLGFPTLLIGYNKVSGFVDAKMYDLVKNNNFSNMNCNYKNSYFPSDEDLNYIYDDVVSNNDIKVVMKIYLNSMKNSDCLFMQNIKDFYRDLKKLSENEQIMNCSFQKEKLVYDLVYSYVGKFTLRPETLNIFINADYNYELFLNLVYRIDKLKDSD